MKWNAQGRGLESFLEINKPEGGIRGRVKNLGELRILVLEKIAAFAENKNHFFFNKIKTAILNTTKKLLAFVSYPFFYCSSCVLEPFSLKMYIGSAKTYDFCMFVCFAFMYTLISCLHTCMLSSDIKRAHRQNIRK